MTSQATNTSENSTSAGSEGGSDAASAPSIPANPFAGQPVAIDVTKLPAIRFDRLPDGKGAIVLPMDGCDYVFVLAPELAALIAAAPALLRFISLFGDNCPAARDISALLQRCNITLVR